MPLSEEVSRTLQIVFLRKKWSKACREKSADAIVVAVTKREYPPTPVTNPEYPRTRFLLRFLLNHIYTADIRDVINKHYILRIISGVKICVRIKSAVA